MGLCLVGLGDLAEFSNFLLEDALQGEGTWIRFDTFAGFEILFREFLAFLYAPNRPEFAKNHFQLDSFFGLIIYNF